MVPYEASRAEGLLLLVVALLQVMAMVALLVTLAAPFLYWGDSKKAYELQRRCGRVILLFYGYAISLAFHILWLYVLFLFLVFLEWLYNRRRNNKHG